MPNLEPIVSKPIGTIFRKLGGKWFFVAARPMQEQRLIQFARINPDIYEESVDAIKRLFSKKMGIFVEDLEKVNSLDSQVRNFLITGVVDVTSLQNGKFLGTWEYIRKSGQRIKLEGIMYPLSNELYRCFYYSHRQSLISIMEKMMEIDEEFCMDNYKLYEYLKKGWLL